MNGMTPKEKYDRIHTFLDTVTLGKLIVLTGGNATGKSLIRKVLWQSLKELKPDGRKPGCYTADTSMERRTNSNAAYGALSSMFCDVGWVATSENSIHNVESVMDLDDRFIVLDEPEVGCSLELQAGLADYINKRKQEVLEKNLGLLVITHSKPLVERLDMDEFFNMEGMTKEEWLNREIVPIDIEQFKNEANETFEFMQDVIKHKD